MKASILPNTLSCDEQQWSVHKVPHTQAQVLQTAQQLGVDRASGDDVLDLLRVDGRVLRQFIHRLPLLLDHLHHNTELVSALCQRSYTRLTVANSEMCAADPRICFTMGTASVASRATLSASVVPSRVRAMVDDVVERGTVDMADGRQGLQGHRRCRRRKNAA